MFAISYSVFFFYDSKSSITSMSAILGKNGFEVHAQAISEGFYKRKYDKLPDLILMENALFKDRSSSVLNKISQDYPGVPRISIISRGEEDSVEPLILRGVDDFIYNDSSVSEILTRIKVNLQPRHRNINLSQAQNLLYANTGHIQSERYQSGVLLMALTTLEEGRFVDINSPFLDLLGYEREEIIGKTVDELNIYGDPMRRGEIVKQIKNKESLFEREIEINTRSGEHRTGVASFQIVRFHDEPHLLTIWNDFSSIRFYEEELNKLYTAIDQSSSMVLVADATGRITYANRKFKQETGYSPMDLHESSTNLFSYVLTERENINHIWDNLEKGEVWEGELINKKKNGEIYWEKASISPVFNDKKSIVYYIAIKENITEKKALNEKILEKNKYDQLRTEFWKFAFLSENEPVLLDNLLSRLGEYLDLDRVSFLKFNSKAKQWKCIEQWIKSPSHEEVKSCELPSWFVVKINGNDYYQVTDEDLRQLQEEIPGYFRGIKNLLIIAYGGNQQPFGFFLLEDFRNTEKRKLQDIKIAKDLSNIVKLKAEALESSKILQRSEEKFRIISETSRDLVCVHNKEGGFAYVSPSSKEMLGYTPQELLGFNPYAMIHSADAPEVEEQFNQVIRGALTNGKNEYRIKRKDGRFVWFETIIQPIRDKNGQVIELQSSSRDITERKQAEQQIREKEEKYRNIFESMFDVYVEVDMNTWEILEISPSVVRISGFTREELLGHSILQLYAKPAEGQQLLDILRKKEKISDFEVTMLNKDGGEVICSYSVRMIKDSNGLPGRMVGTLRDISERKRAEHQLEEAKQKAESASKAKSEFLANMSHEIRTPMNAILGFSEVLMNKTDDEEKKSHLEAILSSGRTLLSLINDILDLSKIEAGKMQINYEPVELPVLIEDIEHIFDKKLKEKDLVLKIDIDKSLPSVLLLDEMRIRQILFNLVGNAIKFTDRGYIKIKVSAKETASGIYELTLIVKDTGVGIPRKQQKLIFNAFQQQDGQDTRRYEGSGLGLSITKKLVEKMNGKIKLDSRIGQGSCFEIILPDIEKGEPREAFCQRETADQTNVTFIPATILIVDDIQYNIDAIKNLIDSTKLTFIEAQNAEKALEIINITLPDIVLMDLKLPNMSGYEATAIIKSNKKLQGIPILAFTASAMASDETEAKTLFDDFITKPISKNELYGKLKRFLSYRPKVPERAVRKENTAVNGQTAKGDFKELRGRLESDLMEDWQEIKENLVIYKIEDFLEKLKQLNQAFNIEPLEAYYRELTTYLNNLDIEKMEHKIKEFPQLVENIKEV